MNEMDKFEEKVREHCNIEFSTTSGEEIVCSSLNAVIIAFDEYLKEKELEILNCPFCGSECKISSRVFGDSLREYYRVACRDKGHYLSYWNDTKEEAIQTWNERV